MRVGGEGRVGGVEDAEHLVVDLTPQHRAHLPHLVVELRDAEGAEGAPVLALLFW